MLVVMGQSVHAQTYRAEYLFKFKSVSAPGIHSSSIGAFIPIEIVIKYEMLTDGERIAMKGVVVNTEGKGLDFREQGAERAYFDLVAHKVFLEQSDSMDPTAQRLGSIHRGALLDSSSCFSRYFIAEYDSTYTITFCNTVPRSIHLAMPFEDPPGGVTRVESQSVSVRLTGYRKVSDDSLSLPEFPDTGLSDGVFYFLPK